MLHCLHGRLLVGCLRVCLLACLFACLFVLRPGAFRSQVICAFRFNTNPGLAAPMSDLAMRGSYFAAQGSYWATQGTHLTARSSYLVLSPRPLDSSFIWQSCCCSSLRCPRRTSRMCYGTCAGAAFCTHAPHARLGCGKWCKSRPRLRR